MANKVYQKLQTVRAKVQAAGIKKTGWNDYSKYHYFQLDDFLPTAIKEFAAANLCPIFNTTTDENGERLATLVIVDSDNPDDTVSFVAPFIDSNMNKNPIQNFGSSVTYLRRYLYMMALDISETDIIDASSGSDADANTRKTEQAKKTSTAKKAEDKGEQKQEEQPKTVELATKEQVGIIRNLCTSEQIQKSFDKFGKTKLEDLTVQEASLMIKAANAKKKEEQ